MSAQFYNYFLSKESKIKICKIINKTVVKSGKIQYNFYGGGNLLAENSYNVGDTIVFRIPENTVEQHLPMNENTNILVFRGKNKGIVAKVKKIEGKRMWVEHEKKEFEVPKDFVLAIGEKPVISVEMTNE